MATKVYSFSTDDREKFDQARAAVRELLEKLGVEAQDVPADGAAEAAQGGADPVFARALELANDFNGEALMASEMVDRGDWEAARASAEKASASASAAGMVAFGRDGDGLLVALVARARGMVDEALAAIAEKRAASASYLLSEAVQAATHALGLVAFRGL